MAEDKVKLSKEDKEQFSREIKTANPIEWLEVAAFLEDQKEKFAKADWEFMWSYLGRRGERLIKNVVQNFSFEDRRKSSERSIPDTRTTGHTNSDNFFT